SSQLIAGIARPKVGRAGGFEGYRHKALTFVRGVLTVSSMKPCLMLFGALLMQTLSVTAGSIHDIAVKDIDGKDSSLKPYAGKVLLVVNVASHCGFTPQYRQLESVYEKYKDKGFVVLGFPCNQFGAQEPGTNEEIKQFCSSKYNVSFPMFDKIEVNG